MGQINNVLLIIGITALMAVVTAALAYFIDVLSLVGRDAVAKPLDMLSQQTAIAERQD